MAHTSLASSTAAELNSHLPIEDQSIVKLEMNLRMKRAPIETASLHSGARQTAQLMLSLRSLMSTFKISALTPMMKATLTSHRGTSSRGLLATGVKQLHFSKSGCNSMLEAVGTPGRPKKRLKPPLSPELARILSLTQTQQSMRTSRRTRRSSVVRASTSTVKA